MEIFQIFRSLLFSEFCLPNVTNFASSFICLSICSGLKRNKSLANKFYRVVMKLSLTLLQEPWNNMANDVDELKFVRDYCMGDVDDLSQ